jgi:hypothetical protein
MNIPTFEINALPHSFVIGHAIVGRAFVDNRDVYVDLPTAAYLMGFSSPLTIEMLVAEAYKELYLINGYKCVNIAFVWEMFIVGRFQFTPALMSNMRSKLLTMGFTQFILSEYLVPCLYPE